MGGWNHYLSLPYQLQFFINMLAAVRKGKVGFVGCEKMIAAVSSFPQSRIRVPLFNVYPIFHSQTTL